MRKQSNYYSIAMQKIFDLQSSFENLKILSRNVFSDSYDAISFYERVWQARSSKASKASKASQSDTDGIALIFKEGDYYNWLLCTEKELSGPGIFELDRDRIFEQHLTRVREKMRKTVETTETPGIETATAYVRNQLLTDEDAEIKTITVTRKKDADTVEVRTTVYRK